MHNICTINAQYMYKNAKYMHNIFTINAQYMYNTCTI